MTSVFRTGKALTKCRSSWTIYLRRTAREAAQLERLGKLLPEHINGVLLEEGAGQTRAQRTLHQSDTETLLETDKDLREESDFGRS